MSTALRRKRGTAMDNVQLVTSVPQEHKDLVFRMAKQAGISASEAMELILEQLRTDMQADGLPSWFDRKELPQALPIAKAS
ncbi:hypothetical protein [Paenarthrobacter ureafaciens]|uniref:hypothetical protein n=1 Tax=Paenarthrobacter ureafaciens TaxID=37931 RepID=UPI003463A036